VRAGAGITARKVFVLAPTCLLAVWASFQIAYATRHGAHDSPDSASYLGAADNLRRGRGLTVPDRSCSTRSRTRADAYQRREMPTMVGAGVAVAAEPAKCASPNVNSPPSAPTNQ